jgi:ribosome-associated protein
LLVTFKSRSSHLSETRAKAKPAAKSKAAATKAVKPKAIAAKTKSAVKAKSAPKSKAPAKNAVKAAGKAPAKAMIKQPKVGKAPAVKASKTAKPARPELLNLIVKILDDGKAEDVVELNLIGRNPMTDYMVVASGRSQRHVAALAEQLQGKLKEEGFGSNIEGLSACDWVLVDALDVVVHLFRPEVRSFYDIEQMWANEPAIAQAS